MQAIFPARDESYYFCVFPVHACGFCSLQLASYPAGQHVHVKLLMLRQSSTWLVGTGMTYLFRYRPRREVRQGVFSKVTALSVLRTCLSAQLSTVIKTFSLGVFGPVLS